MFGISKEDAIDLMEDIVKLSKRVKNLEQKHCDHEWFYVFGNYPGHDYKKVCEKCQFVGGYLSYKQKVNEIKAKKITDAKEILTSLGYKVIKKGGRGSPTT